MCENLQNCLFLIFVLNISLWILARKYWAPGLLSVRFIERTLFWAPAFLSARWQSSKMRLFCRVTSGQLPKFSTKKTWKRKDKTRFNAWKPKTAKLCSINVRSSFEWSLTPRSIILKLSSWSRPIGALATWTIRHLRVQLCKAKIDKSN